MDTPFDKNIGIWSNSLDRLHVREAAELTAEIEELGYSALWFGENTGREAFTNASVLLSATQHLTIATGIANIYGRDPMAANAARKTLEDSYPGRFVLGLGVSHMPLVERNRKHAYTPPISAMESYLDAMSDAPFTSPPPSASAPTLLAALGPRMLDLARDKADGTLTYLSTPEHTQFARERLGPNKILAVEQAVILSEDRDYVNSCAHEYLDHYTGLANYRNNWTRIGFGPDDYVRGGSDRLADAMVAWGSDDAVSRRINEHFSAGASHVCVQFVGTEISDVRADDWRHLASSLLAK